MMKQFLLCLFASTLSLAGMAQDNNDKKEEEKKDGDGYRVRIGLEAGPNISSFNKGGIGDVSNRSIVISYRVGMYADIEDLPIFSLQPGIFLTGKGAKYNTGDKSTNNYAEITTRPVYLEIPVNGVFKLPLPGKVKLFAGAGPYLGIGLWGNNKIEAISTNYESVNSEAFSEVGMKRLDFGFNVLAGIEINHFTLNGVYGYGVTNVNNNGGGYSFHNRSASIQVGYLLGK